MCGKILIFKQTILDQMPGILRFSALFVQLFMVLFLSGVISLSTLAQSYPDPANWQLEEIPVADHLGSRSIKSISEDHQGFLWLATNNGVARYDGYTFKNYPAVAGDSTTLNHSRPDFIYVDHQGVLWVGGLAGINRYLPECDCFKQYNAETAAPNTMPDGGINWITEDNKDQMWVAGQYGGLYRYDRSNDRFERFLYRPEDPVDLSGDQVRVLLSDREGRLWIGAGETSVSSYDDGGLIRFDPETGRARRYVHDPEDEYSLMDNRISALLQDSEGRIWVGSCNNGLHQYDPDRDHFIRMMAGGPESSEIYAKPGGAGPWTSCPHIRILHEDQWGGIWVGNYNGGLYRFDSSWGPPRLFEHDPGDTNGLANNLFWTFLEDSQGRFWLGNIVGGLYKVDPWKNKFQVHFPKKVISGVFESPSEPNVIWVGVWDEGAYRWDRNTGAYQLFQFSGSGSNGPSSNRIKVFFEDSEGKLWLGHDKGLSRYDRKTSRFTHFPILVGAENDEESIAVYAIHEDTKGFFWLGSWGNGLFQFDKSTGSYRQYNLPHLGEQEDNKFNQSIYVIHEDADGRLWLGSWMGGLYLFDRETARFTHYLEGIGIRTIFKRESGVFWLGTGDHGLIEFAPNEGILRTFTINDHLPGNKVYTILEDREKILWLGANLGIYRFDPKTESVVQYDRTDGLPTNQFMDFSALKASDGVFYFGSVEGLVSFRPEQIMGNTARPVMHIQDILVFNKSYRKGEVDSTGAFLPDLPEQLALPYNQNELTFEYVGLHYTAPELNRYRHRLLPYERQWIEAGDKRSARYTNLGPGEYRFEVIAGNSDGVWAEIPAAIDIRIRPPWWRTWWAYLLYSLTAFLLLYAGYRFQKRRWALQNNLQREQEKSQRLKELDDFKSRFYANITHEFRTPLTVIQGLAEQIGENPKWKTQEKVTLIKNNSERLLQLINKMLDLSKLEAGKLEPEYVQGDIIKYLGYLVESFHSLAHSQKVTLSFHAFTESLPMDYDPGKCRQVVGNLISNAIKFTPEYGRIKMVVKVIKEKNSSSLLEIEVKDTGVGIPQEKLPYIFDRFYQVDDSSIRKGEGTGLGLSLVKELLNLMGGNIQVQSDIGKGSTFTCRLPIRNEAGPATAPPVPEPVAPRPQKVFAAKDNNLKSGAKAALPIVLIVEDNQDVIYYLRDCLQGRYRVLEAHNGRQGLDQAFEHIPDLVISDVMMPETDGFELCRALKTDERTNHIPVILLTAKVTQSDKIEGLTHGADVYLTKPFQKEELLLRMENLLELRRRMQQKYRNAQDASDDPEDAFLQKVRNLVESKLEDPNFGVLPLSRALGMSRVQVHRKLKALTDASTSQYIRTIRLQKAYELLKDPELTVAEVGYRVGYKDPAHFSRSFSRHFGAPPREMRR
jgi:signal transduction histidine kinase/ligand-binding sensor domain-containing protein/AraC-like DNA-binding protein